MDTPAKKPGTNMTKRFQMNRICKTFRFCAAHRLDWLPVSHKCHHLHGHTYRLDVIIEGECTPAKAWLFDFAEISNVVKEKILSVIDHKYLNDIDGLQYPTAENLCYWILDRINGGFPRMTVRVWETPDCYAEGWTNGHSRTEGSCSNDRQYQWTGVGVDTTDRKFK